MKGPTAMAIIVVATVLGRLTGRTGQEAILFWMNGGTLVWFIAAPVWLASGGRRGRGEGGSVRTGLFLGVLIGAAAGIPAGWILSPSARPEISDSREEASSIRQEAARLRAEIAAREAAGRAAARRGGSKRTADEPATAEGDASGAPPGEDLAAEAKRLRDELDAWRKVSAGTATLLETLADTSASADARKAAAEALAGQCNALAHVEEIIAALRGEMDQGVREALLDSMGRLAAKSGSEELYGAVLDAAREWPGWIPASRMLGYIHRTEGIDRLRAYLDDPSPGIRWAATRALGQEVDRGEASTAALKAAETSGDPGVRGLSALYLAGRKEPFAYEGMVDDWREMIFTIRMDDLQSLDLPEPGRFFLPLPVKDKAKVLLLLREVAQRHPDERMRGLMGEVMKLFPAAAPEGEEEGK